MPMHFRLYQCLCIYLKLTFARPNAFRPCVLKLGVAKTSTPPKPSTTTTATTELAGFIGATLGTFVPRLSAGSGVYGGCGGSADYDKRSHGFCTKGKMSV